MERLAFSGNGNFSAIEAAIHLNRYMLARRHCQGRKVLDLACGEGWHIYGDAGVPRSPRRRRRMRDRSARQHFPSPHHVSLACRAETDHAPGEIST